MKTINDNITNEIEINKTNVSIKNNNKPEMNELVL